MLYVLYGSDTHKAREKVRGLVDSLLKRQPDASHFRLDGENYTPDALAEYISGQGLFSGRMIVVLDRLFEDKDARELVLARARDIADSENIFIVLEGTLDKKTLTKLERVAEKTQEFSLAPKAQRLKPEFNVFSLTDALGNRDRKKLWVLYRTALREGSAPEELHGLLFWQVKTMLLVSNKQTAGLKPFVVGKAKRFTQNYSPEELKNLSSSLVSLYHDARQGAVEFDVGLEQFVLSL